MDKFPVARLEDWYRDNYFTAEIDISGSGVEDYSMREVRQLAGLSHDELDELVFNDSRTLGGAGIRRSIADRFAGGDPERVMVTNGSTEAIYIVMKALLSPGDEIIITDPYYHSYQSVALTIGCTVKKWELRFEDNFEPVLDDLANLLSERTRMVLVNFPHNPTGASLGREDQQRLIDMVAARDAYLMWDAAFADLIYGDDKLVDLNSLYERSITVHTFSKAYGLPGMRVGWCVAAPHVFEQCVRIRDFTVLFMSPLLELIAQKVVDNADRFTMPRLEQARRNFAYLSEWLTQQEGRVEWVKPKGGVTIFAKFVDVPDSEAFCSSLIESKNVLLTPGTCFGRADFVRMGFGGSSANLEVGLARLSAHMFELGL